MSSDKSTLPAVPATNEVAVFTPPASFEVVDRGAAETFKFEVLGTTFVGIFEYIGTLTSDDGEMFAQAIFTGPDGKPYSIFPGANLERALKRLSGGEWVRITYDRDIDTGKPSPMKSYVVERGM